MQTPLVGYGQDVRRLGNVRWARWQINGGQLRGLALSQTCSA